MYFRAKKNLVWHNSHPDLALCRCNCINSIGIGDWGLYKIFLKFDYCYNRLILKKYYKI